MKQLKFSFLIISLIMILSNEGWGQINISSGNTITESFSIGTLATATLPTGWKVDKNLTVKTLGTYSSAVTSTENRAGNKMSSTAPNGIYNYGAGDAASATDRAVGWISSGDNTKSGNLYVYLSNNGSSTISNFTISYNVEKYRNGSNPKGFSIQMYYSTNGSNWTSAGNDFLTSFTANTDNSGFANAPGATVSVSNKTLDISVPASSSIYLAWNYSVTSDATTSNAQGLGIDDVSITANASSTTPTITLNTTGFSGDFGSIAIGSSSSSSSFNVSGSNLTSDISVTPPTGFEIRTGTNAFSTSSITLTQSGGTVNSTTIDARFTPTISGLQSGNIAITSTGATTQNVAVSGTGYTTPTTQASNITFSSVQSSQMTVNWTSGNGAKRIVIMNTSNSFTNPSDGTDPSANTVYGGSGEQVVYNNNSNSVTVTGLTANTTYWYRVYEYNGSGTGTKYLTSTATGNPNSQETTSNLPTLVVNPTSLSGFSTEAGTASANQTYTISGSYLTQTDGQITIGSPTNFEVSSDGTNYYNSISVAYTGGVLNSKTIYVRVASNSTTGSISGNVSNSGGGVTSAVNVALSGFVYASKPTTQPTDLAFANVTTNSFDLSWTNGNGSNTIVLIKSGSAVNSNPVTGTSYTANATFGSGDQIGSENYVIYNSTGTLVSVTGLSASTTYYVALYSFNGSGSTVNYLTTNPLTGNQTTSTPAATTYTWIGAAGDGLWSTATNWSPTRETTATTDVLQFNDGTSKTITGVPTQTIGQFLVTNNTTVNLQSAAAVTLTISGSTETDLSVTAGSQLNFNGTNALTMTVGTGATGSISGSMTFTGAAHRLIGTDESSITFGNGSMFTASTGFSGNAFGTGTGNSIIFANGSTYVQEAGASPFGATAPNSVVDFQTVSNYIFKASGSPSLSGRTYGNLIINSASTDMTDMTGTKVLNINGDLTIQFGIANINLTASINITGNISVLNGAQLGFIPASANTITLNGTSAQTITNNGTLTFGSYSTINLNNSNGLTLGSNITMNALTLTAGKILLGDYNLTLATITGGNASNYIVADGTGALTISSIGNSEKLFPIGTADAYSPVWITNSGTAGDYSINVVSDATGTNNGADRVKLKWDVNGPASSNTKLRIGWLISQEGTNFTQNRSTYANLWHLYSGNWVTAGSATLANGLEGEFVDFTLYATGITVFSPFGTGRNESSMPVTLASLTSNVNGRNIVLNWSTSSEINNAGFDVERKSATGDWQKTGYVKGNGTTNENKTYSYKDMNLQTGKYYYRLKQIDYNGNFEYHNLTDMIEVGVPEKFALSQNYPNPFNPVTKINFDLPKDSKVDMRIYDMLGREVALLLNEVKTAGYYTINFNASRLSSGIYFYRLSTGDFSSVKKLVVIK